jgi:hypothetical protein
VDNIKIDLRDTGWGGMDWIDLAEERDQWNVLVNTVMINECGAVGGMTIGRGNRSTRKNPAPVPICPQKITHDLTFDRTPAAAF